MVKCNDKKVCQYSVFDTIYFAMHGHNCSSLDNGIMAGGAPGVGLLLRLTLVTPQAPGPALALASVADTIRFSPDALQTFLRRNS